MMMMMDLIEADKINTRSGAGECFSDCQQAQHVSHKHSFLLWGQEVLWPISLWLSEN